MSVIVIHFIAVKLHIENSKYSSSNKKWVPPFEMTQHTIIDMHHDRFVLIKFLSYILKIFSLINFLILDPLHMYIFFFSLIFVIFWVISIINPLKYEVAKLWLVFKILWYMYSLGWVIRVVCQLSYKFWYHYSKFLLFFQQNQS